MSWANKEKSKEYNKKYFILYKEKSLENNKLWWEKNKDDKRVRTSRLYRGIKHRAKRLGIEFNLKYSDISWPEECPVLKIPIWYKSRPTKRMGFNSPSLDRIDPNKGYVHGNVIVISVRANAIKQNATADEIKAVAEYVSLFS